MRYIYQSTFKDQNGAVVGSSTTSDGNPGTITVYLAGTDTLASVYAAAVGGVAVNSVSTDAYGYFYFWVDDTDYTVIDQRFKIVLTHPDFLTRTYDNIFINGISTTYLQEFITNNPNTVNFTQTGTGATTVTIQDKAKEHFSANDFGTFAEAVAALIDAGGGRLIVPVGTFAISDDLTVPETIELEIFQGGLLEVASSKTLTISGKLTCGEYQVFSGSGTVVFDSIHSFNVHTVQKVYPEWWGEFPNGTDDTDILNKAIAATKVTWIAYGTIGYAELHIGPGAYYIRPDGLDAISCSVIAPEAYFTPTDNDTSGRIFLFSFTEGGGTKNVKIGGILGTTSYTDDPSTHYHTGITMLQGDGGWFDIGWIANLSTGISLNSEPLDKHIGINKFHVGSMVGMSIGIFMQSGYISTTNRSAHACEANSFDIDYMSYVQNAVIVTSASDQALCVGNHVRINTLELHTFPLLTVNGFDVTGNGTIGNTFSVVGGLAPPAAGSLIMSTSAGCSENIFKLTYVDWDFIYLDATSGYNILDFASRTNTTYPGLYTNSFGRSDVVASYAPATGVWRVGDRCWNSAPAAGGYIGWVCVTSGTSGGTWKGFGLIQA